MYRYLSSSEIKISDMIPERSVIFYDFIFNLQPTHTAFQHNDIGVPQKIKKYIELVFLSCKHLFIFYNISLQYTVRKLEENSYYKMMCQIIQIQI